MGGETPPPSNGQEVNKWLDDRGEEVCGRAFSCENLHWLEWRGLGTFAFSAGAHEVRVWPEASASHGAIGETFTCIVQPLILQALGWEVLHAGATVGPEGVLAFCGKSGSGKSTLAFAMRQMGWRQFADDSLVFRLDGDRVAACPLKFAPRLRPASRAHFARAPVHLSLSSQPQPANVALAAVFLLEHNKALTVPRVSLMPPAGAFSALLGHAHCFDAENPTHIRRLVDNYLVLAERVPVFRLEYRPNLENLGRLIDAVVKTVTIGRTGCLGPRAVGPCDSVSPSF
jgi:hypothetical protein